MIRILNLTQHPASAEQRAAGVIEPTTTEKEDIRNLLTFGGCPTPADLDRTAAALAWKAKKGGFLAAMIGGLPALMAPLHAALHREGVKPYYAFSVRQSAEVTLPDGSVRKTSVFKHAGWANETLTEHPITGETTTSPTGVPCGPAPDGFGYVWDDEVHEWEALRRCFITGEEMAYASSSAEVLKLIRVTGAPELRTEFGPGIYAVPSDGVVTYYTVS